MSGAIAQFTQPQKSLPEWLQKYVDRKFRLVFYQTKTKGPNEEGWNQVEHKPEGYREGQNVGVMTGHEISEGRFLVDVDFDWPEGLPLAKRLLPETNFGFGRASRKVSHAFYTTAKPVAYKAFKDIDNRTMLVELRGVKEDGTIGFQTMIPPSIHPSGETVTLATDGEIAHVEHLERAVLLYAVACLLLLHLGHRGLLHDVRLATAGFLLRIGFDPREVRDVCRALCLALGNDVNDVDDTVESTRKRLKNNESVTGALQLAKAIGEHGKKVIARIREWCGIDDSRVFPLTEVGDAEYFADRHGDRVRYDHARGRELLLNAVGIWQPDQLEELRGLVVDDRRAQQKAASAIEDKDAKKQLFKWHVAGESTKRINNTLREARALPPIADDGHNWDFESFLIGAPNGVIDLRTGEVRNGRPEERVTMRVRAPFDAAARCPLWEQTIDAIFGHDAELLAYVHRALGYSLTGDCREEAFFVCYGEGANGKGTLMNTIAYVVGDYADDLPFSALAHNERSGIPADIAKLVGKRFVTASESGETLQLNEARIKALTGRDPITARFLHKNFFTFQPVAKFWLSSNNKPGVRDDSDGFWRRVQLIPFEQSFVGRADMTLKDRLRDESAGILAWLVRGALAWQREGLNPPPIVKNATQSYRRESEPLSEFIAARCVVSERAYAQSSALYAAYTGWCDEVGTKPWARMTSTGFGRRMKKQFATKDTGVIVYHGIGLRADEREGFHDL